MSKRSLLFFYLWTMLVWSMGIFWAVWDWVPHVKVWWKSRWEWRVRVLRETRTTCPLHPSVHETEIALEGACPADRQQTFIEGVRVTIGPMLITWPRSALDSM